MTSPFKVTLHMVASLDGFIARKDQSLSWLQTADSYDKGVDEGDTEEFLKTIDCYVMGSRTYEHAVELSRTYGWAYGDKPTVVLTRRTLTPIKNSIEFFAGDLHELVARLRSASHRSVWVVGGAALVRDFLRHGLADDIRLPIVPMLLGGGTPFFDDVGVEQALHLKDVTAYKNGMVELWYELKRT
jgi:dihydrofolate reductase